MPCRSPNIHKIIIFFELKVGFDYNFFLYIAVFPLLDDFRLILVVMVIWGSGLGMCMSLYSLVIIEYMGIELFPKLFATTSLLISIVVISAGPLIGNHKLSFYKKFLVF